MWAGGTVALTAVLVRVSSAYPVNSDGANIALQGWDLLHGHLLLHGWVTADASYYSFEVPQLAVAEALFGLTSLACHVASALSYAIVAALCVALARSGSNGAAAVARGGAVLAVLAVPVVTQPNVPGLLGAPQHIGTSAYLIGCFLLIERAPGWRFTAPLTGVILCAGQVGDATVEYVAVPAVVLVCAGRALAARKLRSADAAVALAAAVSVPAALLCRAAMQLLGAYAVVPPRTAIAPRARWCHNAVVTWQNVRALFGARVLGPGAVNIAAGVLGSVCLLAVAFGLAKVVWTGRSARRADQLAVAALVINLILYVISTMPTHSSGREIYVVLPCGAVLAARACVPGHIADVRLARAAAAAAAVVALLPLAAAASQPVAASPAAPLAVWLKAHNLGYGIAGYWDASAVTVQSGNQVLIRAIVAKNGGLCPFYWETKPGWYSPSLHRATFVIAADDVPYSLTAAETEHVFGRPVRIYHAAGREILVYQKNLLDQLGQPFVPSPTGKTGFAWLP